MNVFGFDLQTGRPAPKQPAPRSKQPKIEPVFTGPKQPPVNRTPTLAQQIAPKQPPLRRAPAPKREPIAPKAAPPKAEKAPAQYAKFRIYSPALYREFKTAATVKGLTLVKAFEIAMRLFVQQVMAEMDSTEAPKK